VERLCPATIAPTLLFLRAKVKEGKFIRWHIDTTNAKNPVFTHGAPHGGLFSIVRERSSMY
jgi:hypothetical protein